MQNVGSVLNVTLCTIHVPYVFTLPIRYHVRAVYYLAMGLTTISTPFYNTGDVILIIGE